MIRLELKNNATGTVVLLHGRDPKTCSRLVESLLNLAAHPGSVAVQGISGVVSSDGSELVAVHEPDHLRGVRSQGTRFRWSQDAEGWRQVADLLTPFTENQEDDRFQFLDEKGDATIICSTDGQW